MLHSTSSVALTTQGSSSTSTPTSSFTNPWATPDECQESFSFYPPSPSPEAILVPSGQTASSIAHVASPDLEMNAVDTRVLPAPPKLSLISRFSSQAHDAAMVARDRGISLATRTYVLMSTTLHTAVSWAQKKPKLALTLLMCAIALIGVGVEIAQLVVELTSKH